MRLYYKLGKIIRGQFDVMRKLQVQKKQNQVKMHEMQRVKEYKIRLEIKKRSNSAPIFYGFTSKFCKNNVAET